QDLSMVETVTLTIPAIVVVVLGVYPKILLDRIEPSALKLVGQVKKEAAQMDYAAKENSIRLAKTKRGGSK
ncbi:MAG: hypothetical protein AABZ62_02505, partial [Planctomycetota bacterium]